MQYPFKDLPQPPQPKNCTVVKLNEYGEIVKALMVGLTRGEAEGVARAGNRFNQTKGFRHYFRVKEEKYDFQRRS